MKDTMIKDFRFTPPVTKSRSMFDLSKRRLFTADSCFLIPAYVKQVYPGDTFYLSCRHQTRLLSPMKLPIMDNIKVEMHYFFADERILYEDFAQFMGERLNPSIEAPTTGLPAMAINAYDPGNNDQRIETHSIADYMGFPPSIFGNGPAGISVKASPFRMYNQIYNWFYRDQDLTNMATEYVSGGYNQFETVASTYPLRLRQKKKDYFTSCRPWPQKGPDVLLPLAVSAPVYGNGDGLSLVADMTVPPANGFITMSDEVDLQTNVDNHSNFPVGTAAGPYGTSNTSSILGVASKSQIEYDQTHGSPGSSSGLYADLSESIAGTVNQFRLAMAMQIALETDALYGTRYPEHLYGHWGVTLADTAYKPEFLGGGLDFMQFVPVTQTAETTTNTYGDQFTGKQSAFGIGSGDLGGFTYTSESYGWIMAILSIVPDITYGQGIPRELLSADRYDFYLPDLANIGEQPVYNCELYASDTPSQQFETFGYQEPWAHLRFDFSDVAGLMRGPDNVSAGNTSLYQWHLGEQFNPGGSGPPSLNTAFLEYEPTVVDRVIQVTSQPQFLCDLYFSVRAARVLPAFPSRTRLGGI